ncbi:tRNA epoxyqueuosine(34) reductase QueG [Bosea sp. TAB14]|uniref:tRNA epoxyqueuosine(34) reductase QueG n=1 Tax=Bosea sp. TAB14 TaxID=3237481 RepID=UPI003F90FD24
MVRPNQIAAELPAAAERPGAGHGSERPLRQSGLLSGEALKRAIAARARTEGFAAMRVAAADAIPLAPGRLKAWLEAGYHGDMAWMDERTAQRADPRALWSEVRSVIMLGMNYAGEGDPLAMLAHPDKGAISLYARRRDYHDVIKGKLKSVAGLLAARGGGDVKVFVDTAPVMEKPLAQAAGLGWQGKHTVLVSREHGSWLLLGAIYTTAELPTDEPERDHCGSCRRCLDICPTAAFPAPYQLDARRCIAYLTIEHPGHIDAELRSGIGNRIFGCDDCLAVCPWNKFAESAQETRLALKDELDGLSLAELAGLDDAAFRTLFAGTPVKRTGRDRFLRNVLIAIGNSGRPELAASALAHLDAPSPLVRAMAVWALGRLDPAQAALLAPTSLRTETDHQVQAEWAALLPQTEDAA